MNGLTLGLAALGALVIVGLLAHSAWQQKRHALHTLQPKGSPPKSAANKAAMRANPSANPSANPASAAFSASLVQGGEPSLSKPFDDELFGDTLPGLDSNAMRLPLGVAIGLDKKTVLDTLIDALSHISCDEPVNGVFVLAALPTTRRAGNKSFAIEALNPQGEWEYPLAVHSYRSFRAGVQLANRSGALSEIEFSEFVQKVQLFADAVGGVAELPDMRDAVLRGRELDQFASSHDAQISFCLRAKQVAWSPGYVQQQAARLGFVAGSMPGRMVFASSTPGLPPILLLNFDMQAALSDVPEQTALRSIDLALDLPLVDRSLQPYARLCDAAISLAASMGGLITDAQGRMISRDAMDTIAAGLEQVYEVLESRDLAAGSLQARRLFS